MGKPRPGSSWDGYGLLIDGAMFIVAALVVWLAWIVEGKP